MGRLEFVQNALGFQLHNYYFSSTWTISLIVMARANVAFFRLISVGYLSISLRNKKYCISPRRRSTLQPEIPSYLFFQDTDKLE